MLRLRTVIEQQGTAPAPLSRPKNAPSPPNRRNTRRPFTPAELAAPLVCTLQVFGRPRGEARPIINHSTLYGVYAGLSRLPIPDTVTASAAANSPHAAAAPRYTANRGS
uniref:Uncharacterized protein n=1 Tax=Plectus sambesii TaxID=2011161 RepID=A0A914W690_9BILA